MPLILDGYEKGDRFPGYSMPLLLRDGDRVVLALHSERKLVLLTELTRLAL